MKSILLIIILLSTVMHDQKGTERAGDILTLFIPAVDTDTYGIQFDYKW